MPVGRPLEFDPDEALVKAMEAFQANGYEATSTADLTSLMGLSKSSLYQTFGSKRELFLKCLDRYCRQENERENARMAGASPAKKYLIDLFRSFTHLDGAASAPRGSLLVNTACEFGGRDAEITGIVAAQFAQFELEFLEIVERAQSAGEISRRKDPEQLAGMLVVSLTGLQVMARLKVDQRTMEMMVNQVLQQLD